METKVCDVSMRLKSEHPPVKLHLGLSLACASLLMLPPGSSKRPLPFETHQRSKGHLHKEQHLLHDRECTQIDGRQPRHSHCRHRIEKAVDVRDRKPGRDAIHHAGRDEGNLLNSQLGILCFALQEYQGADPSIRTNVKHSKWIR